MAHDVQFDEELPLQAEHETSQLTQARLAEA